MRRRHLRTHLLRQAEGAVVAQVQAGEGGGQAEVGAEAQAVEPSGQVQVFQPGQRSQGAVGCQLREFALDRQGAQAAQLARPTAAEEAEVGELQLQLLKKAARPAAAVQHRTHQGSGFMLADGCIPVRIPDVQPQLPHAAVLLCKPFAK